ncbi:MAG: DUF4331 domain-containing protein, partial [Verrucomicrobiaceae bacterium]
MKHQSFPQMARVLTLALATTAFSGAATLINEDFEGGSNVFNLPTYAYTEDYTLTMVTGDRRTGTRAAVTNATGGTTTFRKPVDNIGNKSIPNYAAYANQFIYNVTIPGCANAGRVFVGQRAEAFAVNLGPSFDLVDYVP